MRDAMGCSRKPLAALSSPREVIRQFTPNWFAATMGTGILSLLLGQLPLDMPVLAALGEVLWLLNIQLFVLFSLLYAARWVLFFDEARRIFSHALVSMFLGTIPMGLATLINGLLLYGVPRWGASALELAHLLWWVDVALALACGILIPFMMFTRQQHSIEQMTAVWLLPVVAAEVAAVSGGLLLAHMDDAGLRLHVWIVSQVLWAFSVPVALSILVILLLRLVLHKLPHESMAASSWLSLGPIATGALGLLVMGEQAPSVLGEHGLAGIGQVAAGIGLVGGLLLWGLGLWWMLLALLMTVRYIREGMAFNLGWWAFTFPLGVYAMASLKLGDSLQLTAFAIFGLALVGLLLVMWSLVAWKTLAGAYRGTLFFSPCIAAG